MTRELLRGYLAVIYDTNLIIYQCFNFTEKSTNGHDVVIDEHPFTHITQSITNYIRESNKKVYTLQIMWRDELEDKDQFALMIKHRMSDNTLRLSLGYQRGEKMPDYYTLSVTKKLIKKINSLKYKPWLVIDGIFKADTSDLNALKKFFDIKYPNVPLSKKPDFVDMSLILYSKNKQFPLISNDNFTEFREELESAQYTHKIIPLMDFRE